MESEREREVRGEEQEDEKIIKIIKIIYWRQRW
jgi:hypothetical protein